MRRRELLTVFGAASAGLGGCAASPRDDERQTEDADDGADGPRCSATAHLVVDPVDPDDLIQTVTVSTDALDGGSSDLAVPPIPQFLAELLEGDTATIEVVETPPLEPAPYVRRNGEFYTIATSVTADGEVTGPTYRVSQVWYSDVEGTDTRPFSELPRCDRWRLNEALRSDADAVVAGYLRSADREKSVLSDGVNRLFVEFTENDSHGRFIEVARTGEGSTSADRIRYSADRVAESGEEFTEYFLETHGIVLDDPDENVETLLEDAIANEGVEICLEGPEAEDDEFYANALDEFETTLETGDTMDRERRKRFSLFPNEYYVQYDGTWYRVERFTGYV